MSRRAWINVALCGVVLVMAAIVWLKPGRHTSSFGLSATTPASAKTLHIEKAGRDVAQLMRDGDGWRLTAPFAARADPVRVQRLTSVLEAKAGEKLPAEGLARYGLEPPLARLTIDGQTFSFGAVNGLVGAQYVLTNQAIYLVPARYAAAIPDSATALASKQLFAPGEVPVSLVLPAFRVDERDGKYVMQPPAPDASQDDFARWMSDWRLASALAVGGAPEARMAESITAVLKDGRTIAFDIVQREPDLVLARRDEMLTYRIAKAAAQRLLAPPAAPSDVRQ